jgi:hypothetical protein
MVLFDNWLINWLTALIAPVLFLKTLQVKSRRDKPVYHRLTCSGWEKM